MKREVILASKIGFCFGVKRAVGMAEDALEKKGPIYSLGSIIHNRQVVDDLARKGLEVIKGVGSVKGGTIVVSSHGLSPKISADILRRGIKIIDTTCPFVLKAQRIARDLSNAGYTVIVVGDAAHPEVRALVDFVPSGGVFVVKDKFEAKSLKIKRGEKVSVISQTTQSTANFLETVKVIAAKSPEELKVCNTICRDAETRQEIARALAGKVDLMLVVGGKDSANTRRLLEVCRKGLKNSHLVETERDIKATWFKDARAVGITSGASTPDSVIKRVVQRIKAKGKSKKVKVQGKSKN